MVWFGINPAGIYYLIPAKYKRPILDELAKLGIDYSFIYPEDHAKKAEMIKDKYLGL